MANDEPAAQTAKRIEMDRRMRWIETSLKVLGRVDVPAYRRAFHLSPQNASKDFARYSAGLARMHDLGLIQAVFRLSRGRLFVGDDETTVAPEAAVFGSMPLAEWARITIPQTFEVIDSGVIAEPDREIFSEIVKAIIAGSDVAGGLGRRLRVRYFSASSGESVKEISPHTIVQAAGRHHVRAFDHSRNRGADFVLGRILEVEPASGEAYASDRDVEWSSWVELKLSVDAEAPEEVRRALSLAYGIPDAEPRIIRTRAALKDYVVLAFGLRPPGYPEPALRIIPANASGPFETQGS